MNQAVDAARQGQLSYLAGLDADTLKALCRKKDEDHRSLLHTACGSGQLEVVQLLAQAMQDRCAGAINDADEDVSCMHDAGSLVHDSVMRTPVACATLSLVLRWLVHGLPSPPDPSRVRSSVVLPVTEGYASIGTASCVLC